MKKTRGFSLVELLICLIIISVLLAILTPIISKKLNKSAVALVSQDEITTDCADYHGENCTLCTKKHCINCKLENCAKDEYINNKKCSCQPCKDWGEECLECNSKGCTRCSNSPMRYIENNKCELCPPGHYCNGIKDYASCPSDLGYYCDSAGIHKCSDKFDGACTICSATGCSECTSGYFFNNSTKKCEKCRSDCATCTSTTNCQQCWGWYYLRSDGACVSCGSISSGCSSCTSTYCKACGGGYYLNSSGKCTICTNNSKIPNCLQCVDNKPDNSPVCAQCTGGYYLNGSTCSSCSSKWGANCLLCNDKQCLSCDSGYFMENPTSNQACKVNDSTSFQCSDSNFMKIGNLCVTRKNMGDSMLFPIPASVSSVQVGQDYCYSTSSKCCWKGATAPNCNSNGGSYSGCNRTVCNWNAAKDICSSFKYADKTWRLPTKDEINNWGLYSIGLGDNGLGLCDSHGGNSSLCDSNADVCLGSTLASSKTGQNACSTNAVWSGTSYSSTMAYYSVLYSQGIYTQSYRNITTVAGVRCVTEME